MTSPVDAAPGTAAAHGRAVALLVAATLMWSIAGVVTRQLESARAFETTFWRSATCVLALVVLLAARRGPAALAGSIRAGGALLWLSGCCWAVMFTAFMLALTMTSVANVLVTMAIAPLLTALVARAALGTALPARTWAAIVAAGAGIAWMQSKGLDAGDAQALAGVAVALGVPIAAAVNWTLIQKNGRAGIDLLPAVLLGAVISTVLTLPAAWPFAATSRDVAWLSLLGVFQLAVPCLVAVAAARSLRAPEAALISLLEIVFGVSWAWLAGVERPTVEAVGGGSLVLGALVANETWALRRSPRLP